MGYSLRQVVEWLKEQGKNEFAFQLKRLLEADGWDDTKELSDYIDHIKEDMVSWLRLTPHKWKSDKALRKPMTMINYFLKENKASMEELGGREKCSILAKELAKKFKVGMRTVMDERGEDRTTVSSMEIIGEDEILPEVSEKKMHKLELAKKLMKKFMKAEDYEFSLELLDIR